MTPTSPSAWYREETFETQALLNGTCNADLAQAREEDRNRYLVDEQEKERTHMYMCVVDANL